MASVFGEYTTVVCLQLTAETVGGVVGGECFLQFSCGCHHIHDTLQGSLENSHLVSWLVNTTERTLLIYRRKKTVSQYYRVIGFKNFA